MILYHHLTRCRFLYRVNRFIAVCDIGGEKVSVHVKNTGRLGELLLPDAPAYLEHSANPLRKTAFDLVAVENRGHVVNIDSQAPNAVVREWIEGGGLGTEVTGLRAEVFSGDSRYDFAYTRGDLPGLVEVKGVTLFDDEGTAYFPDAPTQRGVKHLRGLTEAAGKGTECSVCFVLQRDDVLAMRPNDATHPAFGEALREAAAAGVHVFACACHVEPDCVRITHTVPVIL